LIIDPDGKLTLAICSKCFQAAAGWHAKVTQRPRLIQKAQFFLKATFWIFGGSFRLRRPDQINSASGSAKP
jgi:hypothetical protein